MRKLAIFLALFILAILIFGWSVTIFGLLLVLLVAAGRRGTRRKRWPFWVIAEATRTRRSS